MKNHFAEKDAEYYLEGLQKWEHRWENSVELQEHYVEKKFLKKCLVSLLSRRLFRPPLYIIYKKFSFLLKVNEHLNEGKISTLLSIFMKFFD